MKKKEKINPDSKVNLYLESINKYNREHSQKNSLLNPQHDQDREYADKSSSDLSNASNFAYLDSVKEEVRNSESGNNNDSGSGGESGN